MEEKKIDELLKEIYGEQTSAFEKMAKAVKAWKAAALVFAVAFAATLCFVFFLITHPLTISVRGLPVRGVGGFGVNVVTPQQLKEFGKNAAYLLCDLSLSNVDDRFDALATISTPLWSKELRRILRSTKDSLAQLDMAQACSVRDKAIKVKALGKDRFVVKVPADMVYWIKGKETKGRRLYVFYVRTCPATGKNPYGFCIERWDIENE